MCCAGVGDRETRVCILQAGPAGPISGVSSSYSSDRQWQEGGLRRIRGPGITWRGRKGSKAGGEEERRGEGAGKEDKKGEGAGRRIRRVKEQEGGWIVTSNSFIRS